MIRDLEYAHIARRSRYEISRNKVDVLESVSGLTIQSLLKASYLH